MQHCNCERGTGKKSGLLSSLHARDILGLLHTWKLLLYTILPILITACIYLSIYVCTDYIYITLHDYMHYIFFPNLLPILMVN
jgi:hypothetical protein